MNLEQCLRDVEMGTSGKEHAEWLRTEYQIWTDPDSIAVPSMPPRRTETLACVKPEVLDKARADAVKTAQECRELERGKSILKDALNGARKQFWEVVGERDKLQADFDAMTKDRDVFQLRFSLELTEECATCSLLQAEVERLTKLLDWLTEKLGFAQDDAEDDAMELDKLEKERDKLQAKLDMLDYLVGQELQGLRQECKGLQAELEALRAENEYLKVEAICSDCGNRGSSAYVGWENDLCQRACTAPQELQDRLAALRQNREQVKELQAENELLKAELADEGAEEQRCETCRHVYREGGDHFNGCEKNGAYCPMNGWKYWEAKDD